MDEAPGFRPLYRQVYDYLVRQVVDGHWGPGEALPSEQALAAQLGVSQGTLRKALDVMTAEKLVERRQGKGTYVARHTQERALFRFFRLAWPDGPRATPSSSDETIAQRGAREAEARKLKILPGDRVFEVRRTRLIQGEPTIDETLILPQALFAGIDQHCPLPNALYELYQQSYGINIVSADEEVRADLARKDDIRRLRVPIGTPLLHIERVAVALDGTRVELRISRCDTRSLVYAVTLR